MSDRSRPIAIVVVGPESGQRDRLRRDLEAILADTAELIVADDVGPAIEAGRAVADRGGLLPVAVVDLGARPDRGGSAAVELHADPAFADTRTVLVTRSTSLHGVDLALRSGALHGMLTDPWTSIGLREMLAAQLATYLVEHAPDLLPSFDHLLDQTDRTRAEQRLAQARAAPERTQDRPHPLLDDERDDEAVEAELVAALDRSLGHPPRIRIGPGTTMIESGDDVGGIYLVLSGVVRLTSTTDDGEVILHESSTGAIVGLLSLASGRRALLTCRSVTEVRAIPITREQLARAMDVEPEIAGLLNRVLIASLARRLRRSDILQAELDRSLAALSEARAQLVANARFTTLGELSAGMAHELNNPAAALQRSLDHIGRDVVALLAPDDAAAVAAQLDADEPELSTAQRRALRREMAAHFEPRFAERLVALGAHDLATAERLAALEPAELERRESARAFATSLRNAERAASRIQALVDSLRAYARGDDGRGMLVDDVDLERTIDSAIRLVTHRIGQVQVVREPAERLPAIVGRPGALQHVWTNLLSNALDALDGSGRIVIRTATVGDRVTVEIEDDGPGIAPDLVERIFEPRFTTKHGRVSYGLGLGLSIARQIVGDHDGTIDVESRPGRTVFTVELPVAGPEDHDAGAALAVPPEPQEVPHG